MHFLVFITAFILMPVSQSAEADRPEWVDQPNRVVIGGDILHWGTGNDVSAQVAVFKAKQMAIKALMEECGGFPHKDIIPWDQHVEQQYGRFNAYARVGLQFESCQRGKYKGAKERFENPEIVKSQELYNKLLGAEMGLLKEEEKEALMKEIRNLAQEEVDFMQKSQDQRISELEEKIKALRNPVVEMPARLPATSSMKIACMKKLQQMERVLQMRAPSNGNLADSSVVDYYNEYQVQASVCNSYN